MSRLHMQPESHLVDRIGWLRAAVLGANDGIVSTASLIVGVASAAAKPSDVLIAGVAGLVAGAMSMAAGEYVSVSSQSDTEHADLARERKELSEDVEFEREELAQIYVKRGVDHALARKVADQLMAKDALGAHARDELGILRSARLAPCKLHLPPLPRLLLAPQCRSRWSSFLPQISLFRSSRSLLRASSLCWAQSAQRQVVLTSCGPRLA